jgi:hypothetical protein
MFNEANVNSGPSDCSAGEDGDELCDLAHHPTLSTRAHGLLTKGQVGECKTIARHDFSHFHRQIVMEHRTCVDESLKFSVLATRIDVRQEVGEQLLVKFSAHEFWREQFGVHAG